MRSARDCPTASALEDSSRSISHSSAKAAASTRTSSASGRVAGRTPIHRLVEEKVARLGGAEYILRAAKAGLQLRLVHINVVSEADLVLMRGTR